jgi:hypothetical protein
MSKLKIDYEWEAPQAAQGPELRATWARLQIVVDGEVVTKVVDETTRSVRDAIYAPLYPLAEWIATNWWVLLHEVASPKRLASGDYLRRHNTAAASEGFALPRLLIQPEGKRIRLSWDQIVLATPSLRFLNSGSRHFDRPEVEEELRRFIGAVIARLEDQGVSGTLLADEWAAVEQATPDDITFCKYAGRLGWDPYALSDQDVDALDMTISQLSSSGVLDEFLTAADGRNLLVQGKALSHFLEAQPDSQGDLLPLGDLRKIKSGIDLSALPWEQGYAWAQKLRAELQTSGKRVDSDVALGQLLGVDPVEWSVVTRRLPDGLHFLDAVLRRTATGSPRFAIRQAQGPARVFTLCRALFEYLSDPPTATIALVTTAHSERQKRNRAFSAEFIAPAEQLRQCIKVPIVTEAEIQEIAQEFGTSEHVIRHQIENHQIARVESGS